MQQTQLINVGAKDAHWLLNDGMELKTNSLKQVVTIILLTSSNNQIYEFRIPNIYN